jgi:hypothetical protein
MKRVVAYRFAIIKKGGQYVKPFIDDSPYLFFKTKRDALKACVFDMPSDYTIIKVKVTVEPSRSL